MTVNNVLLVEINNKGILIKKDFININKMNEHDFIDEKTEVTYNKKSFVYDFISSLRQKINAPTKKKRN